MFEPVISVDISVSSLLSWVSFCWHFIHLCGLFWSLMCCAAAIRGDPRIPQMLSPEGTWHETAREEAPLNTVRLYVFRDEQAASSIQRFSLGNISLPRSLQFLIQAPTHVRLRAVQLHCRARNSYDMNWQRNVFYHWSTGKLAQKDDNASLFQGICSWKEQDHSAVDGK